MNRTPPNARLRTSLVFGAVCPTYWPTRSSRVTATTRLLLDVAEAVQDVGHPHRDGRLAGSRIAGERHVQRRARGGQAGFTPQPIDDQQRGDLTDPRLHRRERDQVTVELREHGLDVRLAEDRLDVRCLRGGHVEHDAHVDVPLVFV